MVGERVGIALGANLGDRLVALCAARDFLRGLSVEGSEFLVAPVFGSSPVGCAEGAPEYLNTVVEMEFGGTAMELLALTQGFEREMGREVKGGNLPRELDLDLLYFGDLVVESERLVLPHPRMLERLFVLQPLAAICGELVLAGDSLRISDHLGELDSSEPALRLVAREW